MRTSKLTLTGVVILFILSVVCRIPFLQRPLTGEHDWLTLHTMLVLRIWDMQGSDAWRGTLPYNYPNPADKYIHRDHALLDSSGTAYFVSFPPFAFQLAWLAHSLLPKMDVRLLLKGINLLLLLLSAVALADVLRRIAGPGHDVLILAAMAMFLYNRAVLMSLGNLYFPLILSVPIWILLVSLYLNQMETPRHGRAGDIGFLLLTALLCYTDWLGFLAAGTMGLLSVVPGATRRPKLAVLSASGAALGGISTVILYSSVAGPAAFVEALLQRFRIRAGVLPRASDELTVFNPDTYLRILGNYKLQFYLLLVSLVAMLFLILMLPGLWESVGTTSRRAALAGMCFFLPVALDHMLLLNHTANHTYAVLKGAPFLTVLWFCGLCVLAGIGREYRMLPAAPAIAACLLAAVETRHFRHERDSLQWAEFTLGSAIARQVAHGDVVFLRSRRPDDVISPNLMYFSGRNIALVDDETAARSFLRQHRRTTGVLFSTDKDGTLTVPPLRLAVPVQ